MRLCILVTNTLNLSIVQTDQELIQYLRNGELNAGGLLYSRYKVMIFSFCYRMLNDKDSANDATQETFLKMISCIQSLNSNIAFKSWLFSIARNEVLMVVRRKKTIAMEMYEEEETLIWNDSTPLTITSQCELHSILMNAVDCLKPLYRETIILRDVEGLTYDEIAQTTGTTVSAVKSKLFKARLVLNEKLTPYFEERKKK